MANENIEQAADQRGELDAVLVDYVNSARSFEAVHRWLQQIDLDTVNEPLRAELTVLVDTANRVADGDDEAEFKRLASALVPRTTD